MHFYRMKEFSDLMNLKLDAIQYYKLKSFNFFKFLLPFGYALWKFPSKKKACYINNVYLFLE